MSKYTFAIGIPTINRYDLLKTALTRYAHDFMFHEIIVFDNGGQKINPTHNTRVFTPFAISENKGVAGSWNCLLEEIFRDPKITHAVIINDDVYWGRKEDEVEEFIAANLDKDFIVTEHNWCNFILPRNTWNIIGGFDTKFFPAYFEDNDYHYRMQLMNLSYFPTPFMNPVEFKNSGTIEKDPSLNHGFEKNRQYYIQKWGGEPGKETVKFPP